jgi:HSP20 family protein
MKPFLHREEKTIKPRVQTDQGTWDFRAEEGKLAVDVAETEQDIVVVSTAAGALYEDIQIHAQADLLTIRGIRRRPITDSPNVKFMYQECFWGPFSRTIVLPTNVEPDRARAEYRHGVLTIVIPKRRAGATIPVTVVEE